MKILSSHQMYEADKATIERQGITSIELMERAATVCFNWLHERLQGRPIKITVFCGVGNNGGDGLVMARQLFQHGYDVSCYVVNFSEKRTEEFLLNYNRLKEMGEWPKMISSENDIPKFGEVELIIDAIFGIGLKRSMEGFVSDLVLKINELNTFVLSLDVPSGLYSDKPNKKGDIIVEATHTLTFQQPKLAFLLPQNEPWIQSWEILDIALDEVFLQSLETLNSIVTSSDIKSIYKVRNTFSHKGTFGHSLIVAGSYGKMGAAQLSAEAALKVGSGLVTTYIPKCGYEIIQTALPEVMVEVDSDYELHYFNYKSNPSVIGIGPGIGTSDKTVLGFEKFLKNNNLPLVVDADALNILSLKPELLELLPEDAVLTPHPKEFERLVGTWANDYDKLEKLKSFSIRYSVIVVLKGRNTVIASGNNLYFNLTGNPGLATAGSGDVLTGLITGLVAQKYSLLESTIFGVYLHGLSADIGVEEQGMETFIASDILNFLGKAFQQLQPISDSEL